MRETLTDDQHSVDRASVLDPRVGGTLVPGRSRRARRRSTPVFGVALALLAAVGCSAVDDDDVSLTVTTSAIDADADEDANSEPDDAATPAETTEPDAQPAGDEPEPPSDEADTGFAALGPATGDPVRLGLVNSEGTPGLDFPEITVNITAAVDYLNQHGGLGNRPIELVLCIVNGSPEKSQECAQELVGSDVEMVLLGLDLFPDYATYTAAGVPVVGVLPILPNDYNANALFLTGGNATINATIASVIQNHFKATKVGIISADNPGANGSEAALKASLDLAGIPYTSIKGGDNETDAGFQGLMREATKDQPDVLVSLYADAGCIGAMRARASLGVDIPVITTGICAATDVLDEVGDDAIGWVFSGAQSPVESPSAVVLREIMAPVLGVAPGEVDASQLGLGALGLFVIMSVAEAGDEIFAGGADVTGATVYEYIRTASGRRVWGSGADLECGASESYSAVCSFTLPFAEYLAGGEVATIEGLESVSSLDYLP